MELQPFKPAEDPVHKPLGMVGHSNHSVDLYIFCARLHYREWITVIRKESSLCCITNYTEKHLYSAQYYTIILVTRFMAYLLPSEGNSQSRHLLACLTLSIKQSLYQNQMLVFQN